MMDKFNKRFARFYSVAFYSHIAHFHFAKKGGEESLDSSYRGHWEGRPEKYDNIDNFIITSPFVKSDGLNDDWSSLGYVLRQSL